MSNDEPASSLPPHHNAAAQPHPHKVRSYALISERVRRHYLQYYRLVFDEGVLDLKTKELIAFGASLMTGAPNCIEGHLAKLRRIGATEAEIEECVAVALGVAGATVVDRADIADDALAPRPEDAPTYGPSTTQRSQTPVTAPQVKDEEKT